MAGSQGHMVRRGGGAQGGRPGAERRLAQSLSSMTTGVMEEFRAHEVELEPLAGSDQAQHLQIPVSGRAGRRPVWSEVTVNWPNPIITLDPTRNDMDITTPHFSFGVELKSDGFVIIQPQVKRWTQNPAEFWVGALLRVAAWIPEAPKQTGFSAIVHMTVFGWAAALADEEEL